MSSCAPVRSSFVRFLINIIQSPTVLHIFRTLRTFPVAVNHSPRSSSSLFFPTPLLTFPRHYTVANCPNRTLYGLPKRGWRHSFSFFLCFLLLSVRSASSNTGEATPGRLEMITTTKLLCLNKTLSMNQLSCYSSNFSKVLSEFTLVLFDEASLSVR